MDLRPSILCPVDFSWVSATALHHAAAIADHFAARLVVLTVASPPGAEGGDDSSTRKGFERELRAFVERTLPADAAPLAEIEFEVAIGRAAPAICGVARRRGCDLVVIGSRGLSGVRKWILGSTTEQVLREAEVPVLVTPARPPARVRLEEAGALVHEIVVPLDLSLSSGRQTRVAFGLAAALKLPVVLVHVVDQVAPPLAGGRHVVELHAQRLADAEALLLQIAGAAPPGIHVDLQIASGEPAREAARIVNEREAGLVVMGLRAAAQPGPRMGSVTYRMLTRSSAVVLALPPEAAGAADDDVQDRQRSRST